MGRKLGPSVDQGLNALVRGKLIWGPRDRRLTRCGPEIASLQITEVGWAKGWREKRQSPMAGLAALDRAAMAPVGGDAWDEKGVTDRGAWSHGMRSIPQAFMATDKLVAHVLAARMTPGVLPRRSGGNCFSIGRWGTCRTRGNFKTSFHCASIPVPPKITGSGSESYVFAFEWGIGKETTGRMKVMR